MIRILIIILLGLSLTYCGSKDKEPTMTFGELAELAADIQQDINLLNLQLDDKDEEKIHQLNDALANLNDDIDRVQYELEVGAEENQTYKKAVEVYNKVLDAYEKAGFNVTNIKAKVNKLSNAVS